MYLLSRQQTSKRYIRVQERGGKDSEGVYLETGNGREDLPLGSTKSMGWLSLY